jgi:hypothetical protein
MRERQMAEQDEQVQAEAEEAQSAEDGSKPKKKKKKDKPISYKKIKKTWLDKDFYEDCNTGSETRSCASS